VLFVIAVAVIVAVGHLRYHEVEEIRAGVKRTVSSDRRIRLANNIRIRRASLALSKAADLHELFEAVKQMLEFEEFAYASLLLGQAGHADVNERALKTYQQQQEGQSVELRNGRIHWTWQRPGVDGEAVHGSSEYWCVRLPIATGNADWGRMHLYRGFEGDPLLVDMNYLSGLFKSELSQAAERILAETRKESAPAKLNVRIPTGEISS
jgi:hypothetical protein